MRTEEEIFNEIGNAELMISLEHLRDYNLIKKHWLEWVLDNKDN